MVSGWRARMELPVGVIENDAKTDQAANLTLWGESSPSPRLRTDTRVSWEPVDDAHASWLVPSRAFGRRDDRFTVTLTPRQASLRAWKRCAGKLPTAPKAELAHRCLGLAASRRHVDPNRLGAHLGGREGAMVRRQDRRSHLQRRREGVRSGRRAVIQCAGNESRGKGVRVPRLMVRESR